jgi:hypothetical protein
MATLDRAIGPFAATLLVIGGIIGSGIFLTTGPMAAALHRHAADPRLGAWFALRRIWRAHVRGDGDDVPAVRGRLRVSS